MNTKGDALNYMMQLSQQARASGDPQGLQTANQIDQDIMRIKSDPRHQDLSQVLGQGDQQGQQAQQTMQQSLLPSSPMNGYQNSQPQQNQDQYSNSPQLNYGKKAVQTIQQPQQSQQSSPFGNIGGIDVQDIINKSRIAGQQLQPNALGMVGNFLAARNGMAPYVSPAQEIATKAVESNLSMAPYKYMMAGQQMNKLQADAALANERTKGMKLGNNMLENPQDNTNFQPATINTGSRGGVTFQNMNTIAQRAGIGASVKPWENQNAKVDAGLHALRVMDQGFDAKTGQFNISKMNNGELNQNLAAIIAGQGQSSDARVEGVRQASLAGDVTSKINYLTGNTSNIVTPQIAQLLYKTLVSQLQQSAQERQPYSETLQNPAQNNPQDYFANSPSYQYYGNPNQQQSVQQGGQQSNGIPSAPPGATHYSPSTGKFYDANGNEMS